MAPRPKALYSDPDAWRIDATASEGALALVVRDGTVPLFRLPRFHGSFYLRPTGRLAGFAVTLEVPARERPRQRRGREVSCLHWESTDLRVREEESNALEGRSILTLGGREACAEVSGVCSPVPCAGTGLPYLKIVLETTFPSLALWWPREARRRLRPVLLTFFGEIRPAGTGPGSPPDGGRARP